MNPTPLTSKHHAYVVLILREISQFLMNISLSLNVPMFGGHPTHGNSLFYIKWLWPTLLYIEIHTLFLTQHLSLRFFSHDQLRVHAQEYILAAKQIVCGYFNCLDSFRFSFLLVRFFAQAYICYRISIFYSLPFSIGKSREVSVLKIVDGLY